VKVVRRPAKQQRAVPDNNI